MERVRKYRVHKIGVFSEKRGCPNIDGVRIFKVNMVVMAKLMNYKNYFTGHNSYASEAILISMHLHQFNMVIYIYSQFHEICFIDTLVLTNLPILNQFMGHN